MTYLQYIIDKVKNNKPDWFDLLKQYINLYKINDNGIICKDGYYYLNGVWDLFALDTLQWENGIWPGKSGFYKLKTAKITPEIKILFSFLQKYSEVCELHCNRHYSYLYLK